MTGSSFDGDRVYRQEGITPGERYLKDLCDRTFLSLWSYPGLYRDQGKTSREADGKELADLLVVFENDIIIFSDKHCDFPGTGDVDVDWARWFRNSVLGGASQVWGAERWLRAHPERVFTDRKCSKPFPVPIPRGTAARFHRIVVAHGSSQRCAQFFGGDSSWSCMIAPRIIGNQHLLRSSEGGLPFQVGQLDPSRGFVHVLDDTALWVLLTSLDTVGDFLRYLRRKEDFISSGRLAAAAGEEDLLAYYLENVGPDGGHDFVARFGKITAQRQPDSTLAASHKNSFTSELPHSFASLGSIF